ncbi:energy transducer TonB [Aquimarina intermedia]|uniref:Protein TonB n=1 Tax=Aquimarina intermedia TaxID=350814 RepID=A0A5S5CBK6_9FLAO|nr:energy transducer TonB [Aquimarina intermedia]TYP76018.1 protein TonB [Aquimarina intermedia]
MSNKKEVNIRINSLFNFQIGLIASLLFTYLMFEMYAAVPVIPSETASYTREEPSTEWNSIAFKVYKQPEPAKNLIKRAISIDPQKFKVIDDKQVVSTVEKEFINEPATTQPLTSAMLPDEPDNEPESFPFIKVEAVPVFPGCETLLSNEEKGSCFSEKIGKIISRKFDTSIGEKYGLKGVQRIYTQFEVGKDGVVKNVLIRAPHPKLEKEARRIIKLLPKMTPGRQRGIPVSVNYQIPIVFKVHM